MILNNKNNVGNYNSDCLHNTCKCPICGGTVIFSLDQDAKRNIVAEAGCINCKVSESFFNIRKIIKVQAGQRVNTKPLYQSLQRAWNNISLSILN